MYGKSVTITGDGSRDYVIKATLQGTSRGRHPAAPYVYWPRKDHPRPAGHRCGPSHNSWPLSIVLPEEVHK